MNASKSPTPTTDEYSRMTDQIEERLRANMALASARPPGSLARAEYRQTARNIYSSWRNFAAETGIFNPDDDVRFQAILRQWL